MRHAMRWTLDARCSALGGSVSSRRCSHPRSAGAVAPRPLDAPAAQRLAGALGVPAEIGARSRRFAQHGTRAPRR
jgi:hypothetical protein